MHKTSKHIIPVSPHNPFSSFMNVLCSVKHFLCYDRLMHSLRELAIIPYLSRIDRISKHVPDCTLCKRESFISCIKKHFYKRARRKIIFIYIPYNLSVFLNNNQFFIYWSIAKRRSASIPHAFMRALNHLVFCPFTGKFSLKLCKGEHDVSQKPAWRCWSIKPFSNRYKINTMLFKQFDKLIKVLRRSWQAVYLVWNNKVDFILLDIL